MTAPNMRALHWQYLAFWVLLALGTVVAALLILRHGPGWGLAAALACVLASGAGISRSATCWNAALDPVKITARSSARALYFARDHQAGRVWRRLTPTTGPAQRAALYRELAGLSENIAVVFPLVNRIQTDQIEQVEALRDRNDEIRLLYAAAGAEHARATGTARERRPWPALERHAGDLLNRIASTTPQTTPQELADLYWQLADRVDATGVVEGTAADLFCSISRSYASRACGAPFSPATASSDQASMTTPTSLSSGFDEGTGPA